MDDKQLEIAAKKLCELRGIDPNVLVGHGAKPNEAGFVPAVLLKSKAWELVKDEILDFINISEAIEHAKR